MNEITPMAGWRRHAGPALALVAAGVVAGAILSSSMSASAADDGSATPSPSAGSSADPGAGVTEGSAPLKSADGKDCPKGERGGHVFGRGGQHQGGRQQDGQRGLRGGPGGFGQAPDGSTSQAPSQAPVQSPTSFLTF